MTLIDNLLNLYRVDSQVRGLRRRVDAAELYLRAQNRELDSLQQQRDELESQRRQVRATLANHETEMKSTDERLEKLRTELNSSVNNKQYTAILTEMNTVKAQRSEIEDHILRLMEQIEQLDQELEQLATTVEERARVRDVASSQLQQREAEVGDRLAELERERSVAAANISERDLALFDELAHMHEGEALAQVDEIDRRHREYTCGACNIALPFDHVASLLAGSDKLIRCTACERILYLADEMRGALAKK